MLDRIPAVVQTPSTRTRAGDGRVPVAEKGDTLRLAFAGTVGDDLLVSDDRGTAIRLAGLAQQARDFVPGDVLLLRVLATSPRLELEFLGTSDDARGAAIARGTPAAGEIAAMRLDQTVTRRISWLLPEPAALATTWYLRIRDAGRSPGFAGNPSVLRLPGPPGAIHESAAAPVQGAIEQWAVPVFAWGSLPAQLRFLQVDDEDETTSAGTAITVALRIELALPVLGAVAVQVICQAGRVSLTLTAERHDAVGALRDALPSVQFALEAAGMLLHRSAVTRGRIALAGPARLGEAQAQQLAAIAAALSPGPFRAVAEVVVVLLSAALAAEVSPASR